MKIFLERHYSAAVRLFTLSRRNADAPYMLRVKYTFSYELGLSLAYFKSFDFPGAELEGLD